MLKALALILRILVKLTILILIVCFAPIHYLGYKLYFLVKKKNTLVEDRKLHFPIVYYRNKQNQTVIFIAVMHVAVKAYFEKIGEHLKKWGETHSVLYEMVKPGKQNVELSERERFLLKKLKIIKKAMKKLADNMGLTYQSEIIDYSDEWIWADVSQEDFVRRLAKNKTSFENFKEDEGSDLFDDPKALWVINKVFMFMASWLFYYLKALLFIFRATSRHDKKVLLDWRNSVAFAKIKESVTKKPVVTIWGAEHLNGIDKMLRKMGFREYQREWLVAYEDSGLTFKEAFAKDDDVDTAEGSERL
ncbi:hypothetical protein COT97_02935 [Candidatus Falkowbacteria bacterium CG10_big_fil_rev_8_21_14_0_10_39_11]|uniref:Uncharacterized protein n=1 Tax=Candidatus Falkowbacteria bacterium CG10_big_fil_rev_8_21_14_0_10_39_11 TaxID=1974565 RepID=A0A2H0V4Y2_9BACT|nr:MAG: hypothetical protein COT97_02935 [Candidatus Falkowbacteria bacterium CG10_big_fil_rev_8_21_14_0_10_39_11]